MDEERTEILQHLLQKRRKDEQKWEAGTIVDTAEIFGVSRMTVWRLWKRAKDSSIDGSVMNVSSRMHLTGSQKKEWTEELDNMKDIPLNKRGNLRSLSHAIKVPKTALIRIMRLQQPPIKRISSCIRPLLTEDNKKERLLYCLHHTKVSNDAIIFNSMYDCVFIDENWFYITMHNKCFYIAHDETPLHRICRSKRFITQVMFLAAVGRPQCDNHRKTWFDGKVGICPLVERVPTQRGSKNRPKGTMETRPTTSVTQGIVREIIINKVFPSIRDKIPKKHCGGGRVVWVQQDNSKPHVLPNDPDISQAGIAGGWNIKIKHQPPNSPDLNILDLGFFASIQSLQQRQVMRTIDELVTVVQDAYEKEDRFTLDNVFLSLHLAMERIMECGGGNNYKLGHIGKEKLRREGKLPVDLMCKQECYENARSELVPKLKKYRPRRKRETVGSTASNSTSNS